MKARTIRNLKGGFEYDSLFPVPLFSTTEVSKGIDVHETIKLMVKMSKKWQADTEKIAPLLKGASIKETCHNIWNFVYEHIQYKLDKIGTEEIRRPAYLWATRHYGGDCDCFAVFIATILKNLGLGDKSYFRVTKYKSDWQHVYVIVENQNENIVIDCVTDTFNYEVPFKGKIDTNINKMPTVLLEGFDEDEIGDLGLFKKFREKIKNKIAPKKDSAKLAEYEEKIKKFISGSYIMPKSEFEQIRKTYPSLYVKYRKDLDAKFGLSKMSAKDERKLRKDARKDARQLTRDLKDKIKKGGGSRTDKKNAIKDIRSAFKSTRKDINSTKTNPFKKLRERIQKKTMEKKGGTVQEQQELEKKIKLGTATEADAKLIRQKYRPLFKKYKRQLNALLQGKKGEILDEPAINQNIKIKPKGDEEDVYENIKIKPKGDEEDVFESGNKASGAGKKQEFFDDSDIPEASNDAEIEEIAINKAMSKAEKKNKALDEKAIEEAEEFSPDDIMDDNISKNLPAINQKSKKGLPNPKESENLDFDAESSDVFDLETGKSKSKSGEDIEEEKKGAMAFIKENPLIVGVGAVAIIGGAYFLMNNKPKPKEKELSGNKRTKSKTKSKTNFYTTK